MTIEEKRTRFVNHLAEAYNAEELAEQLVDTYTDLMVEELIKMFEED